MLLALEIRVLGRQNGESAFPRRGED